MDIKIRNSWIKRFLKRHATIITMADGRTYYFLPFWFEEKQIDGSFFMHHLEKLPPDLKSEIKAMRGAADEK